MNAPFLTDEEALAVLRDLRDSLVINSVQAKAVCHAIAVLTIRIQDRKAATA